MQSQELRKEYKAHEAIRTRIEGDDRVTRALSRENGRLPHLIIRTIVLRATTGMRQ